MSGIKAPVGTLTVQFLLFFLRNNGGAALLLLIRAEFLFNQTSKLQKEKVGKLVLCGPQRSN